MSTTRTQGSPPRRAVWTGFVALAALALSACGKPSPQSEPQDAGSKAEEDKRAEENRQRRSAANLRLMAGKLFDYAVERRHLIPAAICDKKTGQPLLSWRVALLPHVGEEALYQQFDLGEPWDDPKNKKLLDRMPPFYAAPFAHPLPVGMTCYRGFVASAGSPVRTAWATLPAKEAPLGVWGGTAWNSVPDGTSNTIAVVEAAEAVPWTKPGELTYDAREPLPKLGGLCAGGFHAGMMAGSVQFFSSRIDEATLRKFITATGGETVDVRGLQDQGLMRSPLRESGIR